MPPTSENIDKVVGEKEMADTDTRPVWEKMQDKVEDLSGRVARHFEDRNDGHGDGPPIVKSPQQPTAEEWARHQTTHTLCSMVQSLQCSKGREKRPSTTETEGQLGARRGS